MGWSVGYDFTWKRDIGYGVPATCDFPGCGEEIDRGLGYVCGAQPWGGERGCGLFFCGKHGAGPKQLCPRCLHRRSKNPFTPTPDLAIWLDHKLTDETWGLWRADNPEEVARITALLVAMPCETKAAEDQEPGCCAPCRARAASAKAGGVWG